MALIYLESGCTRTRNQNVPEQRTKWETIRDWVLNCLDSHNECELAGQDTKDRPKRLIHVGNNDDYSDVRICSDVGVNQQYMTLSHCWGPSGVSMRLLERNLQQYSAQVPWKDIPRTFQHAIVIVRNLSNSLGVEHLWIDALCIIQDSDTDKQRELRRMSSIYQYALCNLATCLGRDSDCGLWQDSDPLQFHNCVVETSHSNQMGSRVRAENLDLYKSSVEKSVLNSRAWVLQELTLAPRLVYFTAEQLVWQCSKACFYQSSPWQDRLASVDGLKWASLRRSTCLNDSDNSSFDHVYRFWMLKLADFTQRNLSYESDTLPAISAIARCVKARLEPYDEYILGLWKRYLHLHILWQLHTNFKAYENVSHMKSNRPSWSWISVSGRVYNHLTYQEAIETTTCLVTLRPRIHYANEQDRFGDAVSAELDATGVIAKVALHVCHSKSAYPEKDFAFVCLPGKNSKDFRNLTQHVADLDVLIGSRETEGKKTTWIWAYCLFAVWETSTRDSNRQLRGLLLVRTATGRGLYRRIGRFCIEQPECDGLLEEIKSNHPLAENDCLERNEDGSHKITIL
ncbi:hypothetical protein MMC17_008723 [Xylographa soralifera]|nr:hypothetical protein [Xylographa soralifera]